MHARIITMLTRAARVAGAAMMFALPVTTVSRTRSDARSDATVRLYTLDCGHAEFKDFGLGSDTGDFDVFGDGTVRILKTPGHTTGSSALLVKLSEAGPVLLSGDLYVTVEGRLHRHVPGGNADRAATLASMNRIEAIARLQHARVVVQHAPEDFARLPKAPRYLE